MTRMAKHIEITSNAIIVDGEEFDFYISDEPIEVQEYDHGLSVVTLRVYTEKVTAHTGPSLIMDQRLTTYRVPTSPHQPQYVETSGVGASESPQPTA